jgi:hypothetical protein
VRTCIRVVFRVCLVSIFSDACSKQAVVAKIRILITSSILRVLVVTNKAVSLRPQRKCDAFLVSDPREGEAALSQRLKQKCMLNTGKTGAVQWKPAGASE